jgi:hypothetical protein
MNNQDYCYSFDGERYHKFDEDCHTYEKAIKLVKKEMRKEEYTKCYIGIAVPVTIEDILSRNDYAEDVINAIVENTYDNYGEYAENYLEDVPTAQMYELDFMLKNTIAEWLKKYDYKPNFFKVEGEREVPLNDRKDKTRADFAVRDDTY